MFSNKTSAQVIAVIQGRNDLNDRTKQKIVDTIRKNNWTGNDLMDAQTKVDLRDMEFGFASNKLLGLIKAGANNAAMAQQNDIQAALRRNRQQRQRTGNNNNNNNNNNNRGGNGNNNSFKIKYKYNGRSLQTQNTFSMKTTVSEFIEILATGEVGGITAEKTKVIYLGYTWTQTERRTLEVFDFDPRIECIISHRVVGGAALAMDEKKNDNELRERFPDFDNKHISATFDKDDLMFIKDSNLRVKMPCGHVFGAQTVYEIIKMCAGDNSKLKVECPMLKCGKEWNFSMLIAAADLNQSEITRFSNIFSNRAIANSADTRICKGCNNVIERPDNLLYTRVRCTGANCTLNSDFCWICGEKWTGGGFIVCGNKGCAMERINDVLQKCESKVLVKESANYSKKCPVFRACPRCATLVEYDTSCKHMKCWGCNKKFCFYCLGLQDENGRYPCNGYDYQCEPAPRQRFK